MFVEQLYSLAARDQVNMGMQNGLAGDRATVYTDVEPLDGGVIAHDLFSECKQHLLRVEAFLVGHGEVIKGVATGDDEQVPLGDRVEVFNGKDRSLLHQNAVVYFIGTEWALFRKSQHAFPDCP